MPAKARPRRVGKSATPGGRKRAKSPAKTSRSLAGDAQSLADQIGVQMRDLDLLRQALTHRSAPQEFDLPPNERLEFLGDAVLGIAVAGYLYRSHPDLEEGPLTKLKAVAVSEPILANVAREIDLGRYLILSKGEEQSGGRDRPSILSDALEAVFGAVHLDRGFRTSRALILRLLRDHLRAIERAEHEPDHKTVLQEKIQERHRTPPTYRVLSESGPDHDRTFVAQVRVGRRILGSGSGKSKKQAEQAAARDALQNP